MTTLQADQQLARPAAARIGRRLVWPDLLWATLVAGITAVFVYLFRATISPTDPWHYVEGAINFPNGTWNEVGLSRWGMILPLLVFTRLWGNAEAAHYAYPVLAAGMLGGVLYLLGTRLVNRWTGAAATLVTLFPVILVHLSRGYPDLIAVSFVAAAVLFLILARDSARPDLAPPRVTPVLHRILARDSARPDQAPPRVATDAGRPPATVLLAPDSSRPPQWQLDDEPPVRSRLPWPAVGWLLLAGLCVGWGFLVRDLTVLAWPALAIQLLRVGRPVQSFLWFAILPLSLFALDMYLSARVFGDPLLRVKTLVGANISESIVPTDSVYMGHDRAWYATISLRTMWNRTTGSVTVLLALVGAIGGAFLLRRLSPVWTWGMVVFTILWLEGGVMNPSAPSLRMDIGRYSLTFMVPLLLTGICVIAILILTASGWRKLVAALAAGVLALAALIPSIGFARSYEGFPGSGGGALREAGRFFAGQPEIDQAVIWSDLFTQRLIPIYTMDFFGTPQWSARDYRSINRLLRRDDLDLDKHLKPGDYVVVYSDDDETCYHCRDKMNRVERVLGKFPLDSWIEVFRSSAGNLVVYQIPAAS